jgi:hypothetical protein
VEGRTLLFNRYLYRRNPNFFLKHKALCTFYLLILTIDDILFDFPNFGSSNDKSEPKLSLASNSDKDK